jgi:RNA polymerase sigma-70 factor (ECF subfamily)
MLNSSEMTEAAWLRQAAQGQEDAWRNLLARHEGRLRRLIAVRLHPRLKGRLGPEDVLQEVYLEAAAHLPSYLEGAAVSFFFWLRGIACNKLLALHRQHLGTLMRDASREVSLDEPSPEASSAALAAQIVADDTRPSEAAARAERQQRLQDALDRLSPPDREALALRHFEQLTNAEIARILGITEAAARKRCLRALGHLREILAGMPGGLENLWP